ncbi:unnamed protein product [Camellia sinensis]
MGDDDKSLTQYNRDHPKKLRNMEPKLEPDQPDQPHYIAHIPEDILSHVISRMPWRSICRLKCVSMYWYSLINSKTIAPSPFRSSLFSTNNKEPDLFAGVFYQNFNSTEPCFFSADKDIKVEFITLGSRLELEVGELIERGLYAVDENMPLIPFNFYIEACCHGLLLCSHPKPCKQCKLRNCQVDRHYVCNPITKKFIWLPKPPEYPHRTVKTGFLVDQESGHYQVMQIPVNFHADPIAKEGFVMVDSYSSLLRTWRTEHFEFHPRSHENSSPAVFFSSVVFTGPAVQMRGSLYWVATRDVVVCCNVEKKFCFIKQPNFKIFSGLINTPCLGEFNGVLRYLASDSRMVCLWDLQAGEWELVKMVPIDTIAKSLSDKYWMIDDFHNVRPLALQCSNPEMVFLAFPHKWIMSYNLVSEEVNLIERIEMSYLILTPMILIPFVLPKMPLPVF